MMLALAAPAQSALVEAEKTRFARFKGEACGTQDKAVFRIPRRAKDVQLVQPSVGQMLLDFDEQVEIARVLPLKVKPKKRRAVVRAEGAGDICARPESYEEIGWLTSSYDVTIRFKRPARRN